MDFDECYGASFERLVIQLYAYTGDLAQAQDVVQEGLPAGTVKSHLHRARTSLATTLADAYLVRNGGSGDA